MFVRKSDEVKQLVLGRAIFCHQRFVCLRYRAGGLSRQKAINMIKPGRLCRFFQAPYLDVGGRYLEGGATSVVGIVRSQ